MRLGRQRLQLPQPGVLQGEQLALMAQPAEAAEQPPLEPGQGSTRALLLRTLQAPAMEALLALAA